MAIRFRDNQHIYSNRVGNFAGATSFSWSMRIAVESLSGSSQALFFGGRYYSMFSLRFVGADATNVWINAGVERPGGLETTHPVAIPRRRVCHLVGTYSGTTLRLVLNGQQLVALSWPQAPVAGASELCLGVDEGGVVARDYHIGDVRLWRNVVLSNQQVAELRDGVPFTTDPGAPFFAWSCDGQNGADVLAAAPGVSGANATAQSTSAPPPAFSDRSLAYTPYMRIRSAQIGPSGKTLILRLMDSQNGVEITPSAIAATPTLTVDGAPVSLAAPGPIWHANTLSYIVYPLPGAVPETASVRLSAPFGWAVAGVLGPARAEAGLEVANPGPAILPPLPEGPRTMELGWNTNGPYNWSPVMAYANLLKHAKHEFRTESGAPVATYDPATRFPANVTGGELFCRPVVSPTASHDPRGYPNIPSGRYDLLWDGTGNARLIQERAGHTLGQVSSSLAGTSNKRRTYNLTLSPAHERHAQLRLAVSGQIANVRLYGPGTSADGSEKFHPGYLKMLEGARLIRFMDATGTNSSSAATYDQVGKPAHYTHDCYSALTTLTAQVTSIGPYANPDNYFFTTGDWAHLLVTTAAPHGFRSGQLVKLGPLAGGAGGQGRLRLANGADLDVVTATEYGPGPCRVVSPTSFAIAVYPPAQPASQPAGTQSFSGQARVEITTGMPFTDCVELANRVGADPWICVPHAFTDEATAALAADVVAVLGPGRKLYVEYSNEHWNYNIGFQQYHYIHGQAAVAGLPDSQWYAKRTGEVHAIFTAALATARRPASDLIRVFGSQAANTGVTAAIASYCAPRGIPVDAVAIAPYFTNHPQTFPDRWRALDAEQLHDLSDLTALWYRGAVTVHRNALAATLPATKVVCYEGGLELGVPWQNYGSQANMDQAAALSRAWVRHPRARALVLQYCRNLEQEGCGAFAYFSLGGVFGSIENLVASCVWSAHNRTDEPDGLGDGSDGLRDNRLDLQDISRNVSVVGRAVKDWLAMIPKKEDPPAPAAGAGRAKRYLLRKRSGGR